MQAKKKAKQGRKEKETPMEVDENVNAEPGAEDAAQISLASRGFHAEGWHFLNWQLSCFENLWKHASKLIRLFQSFDNMVTVICCLDLLSSSPNNLELK